MLLSLVLMQHCGVNKSSILQSHYSRQEHASQRLAQIKTDNMRKTSKLRIIYPETSTRHRVMKPHPDSQTVKYRAGPAVDKFGCLSKRHHR